MDRSKGRMTMGYETTIDAPEPLFPAGAPALPKISFPRPTATPGLVERRLVVSGRVLRFGGLSLDRLTGVALWQGKALALGEEEHETLAALMEHSGRILSLSQIALLLGARQDAAERRLNAL